MILSSNSKKIRKDSLILLLSVLNQMHLLNMEIPRMCEVAVTCLREGLTKDDKIIIKLKKRVQKEYKERLYKKRGIKYLLSNIEFLYLLEDVRSKKIVKETKNYQNEDGGFGRFKGDVSRIPVTWRVLEVLKELGIGKNKMIEKALIWLKKEWEKDTKKGGGLSYKCSGILISNFLYNFEDDEFIEKQGRWLLDDQQEDGGWSARKNTPVGSIPSYTSLAILALYLTDKEKYLKNIEKGLLWIEKKGLWKEHPIERSIIDFIKMCQRMQNGY